MHVCARAHTLTCTNKKKEKKEEINDRNMKTDVLKDAQTLTPRGDRWVKIHDTEERELPDCAGDVGAAEMVEVWWTPIGFPLANRGQEGLVFPLAVEFSGFCKLHDSAAQSLQRGNKSE